MNVGHGIHRWYRWTVALGAVAIVLAVATLAAVRAPEAKAQLVPFCDTAGLQDFYNNFSTEGRLGIALQIKCYYSSAGVNTPVTVTIDGNQSGMWMQRWIPLAQSWNNDDAWPVSGSGKAVYTFVGWMPCYASTGTWTYRGYGHFHVKFPNGVVQDYYPVTRQVGVPCLPDTA